MCEWGVEGMDDLGRIGKEGEIQSKHLVHNSQGMKRFFLLFKEQSMIFKNQTYNNNPQDCGVSEFS